jgi:TPR repeat protein
VEVDLKEAAHWFSKAAEQGEPVALNDLGNMYNYGMYFKADNDKAIELYRRAAQAGAITGKYNYGKSLLKSSSTEKEIKQGIELITLAADNGLANAQKAMGEMLIYGEYVDINYNKEQLAKRLKVG